MYRALRYKVENNPFYADVRIDEGALNDLTQNSDENILNRLKMIHMEFDCDANEVIFVRPLMEADEGNILEHTMSMASRPPNAQREMELIHAWVNNPDSTSSHLIEWPAIVASPINLIMSCPLFLSLTFCHLFLLTSTIVSLILSLIFSLVFSSLLL